jgi:hypothetical protein
MPVAMICTTGHCYTELYYFLSEELELYRGVRWSVFEPYSEKTESRTKSKSKTVWTVPEDSIEF